MSERRRAPPPKWVYGILAVVLVLLYLPIIVMILNSFTEISAGSFAITAKWYERVFASIELKDAILRSLFVGFVASSISVFLGTTAIVALTRSSFALKAALNKLSYVSLVIPELVFALSLLSWFFILRVELSLFTVVVAHITFSLAYVLMTLKGRMSSLDVSVEDAARDLGASEWRVLFKIILPQLRPAIVASFILAFLLSFDDFLITFYTNGVGRDTLPIRLYVAMKMGLTPELSALATLMFVLSLVLIFALNRARGLRAVIKSD